MTAPRQRPDDPVQAQVNALITEHLPLVRHVVRMVSAHFPRHADTEELVQAGMLGLVEAAQRYDAERGVPFGYWATMRIRGSIIDAVRSLDSAPRSLRAAARQVEHARERLAQELLRTPTDAEIAERAGLDVSLVAAIAARAHDALVLSLDAPAASEEESVPLAELVDDGGAGDPSSLLENNEQQNYVRDAVSLLPERLRDVLQSYFYDGETSESIAARLGVTVSRVSQMRTQALELVREAISAQYDVPAQRSENAGVAERRRQAYTAAVAARSTFGARLSELGATEAHRAASVPAQRERRTV